MLQCTCTVQTENCDSGTYKSLRHGKKLRKLIMKWGGGIYTLQSCLTYCVGAVCMIFLQIIEN